MFKIFCIFKISTIFADLRKKTNTINNKKLKFMKKILTFLIAFAISGLAFGQLTGVKTIPGDYATISAAITDLNTTGVGVGGVTFNVAAGTTETFATPTAGLITATGTAANPIVFQKSGIGANPLITAGVGTSTTVDGIIVIKGGDYITFDGIDLQENVLNTTATLQMEWGYALLKASATDGSQYDVIKNCSVTLNKANTATVGIYSANHTDAIITALTITALSGTNSNNKIFGNTISNAFTCIYVTGFNDVTPYTYYDQGNEIGVTAGNTISNFGGATTSYGIYVRNNNTFKVSNNILSNTGTTSTLRGIYLAGCTNANGDVNNNDFQLSSSALTNQLTAIESAIAGTGTINIFNNNVHGFTYTTATTGSNYIIYNNAASATVNIYNNTISGNASSSASGAYYCIYNNAAVTNLNIYGNTVSNNISTGTGTFAGIYTIAVTNATINNNIINGNQKSGASGTLYLIYASTGTIIIHDNSIYNNSIPSTTSASAAIIYGYYNYGSPLSEAIYNNDIHGLLVGGATTSTSSIVRGLYSNTTALAVKNIYSNKVYDLSITSTGGGTVDGIYHSLGAPANIYKNNIYNLSASAIGGIVNGIYSSSGTTTNIYNNYVSDLKTPAATGLNAINGINIAGGTTTNAYYNTVYINATSSSVTTFGTSGIYSSTTPAVDLRNNIVVNTSTPVGATGYTSAYKRSSTTLTTYAATSNNNDFYAGVPGTNNVIFYDGTTSDQTLAAFKTRVSTRDAASISENPNWVSTTGTNPTYLHINTTIATGIESGAAAIATYTDDFDGDVRNLTTPDIGADEFTGIPLPLCTGTPAVSTINGTASVCNNTGITLTLSTTYTDLGITYQWKYATVSGGPYTNMGTSATQATGNLTATTYYVCDISCSYSSLTYTTAEKMVSVNALPLVAVTPTSANYCSPAGTPIALTASGADTYAWSPVSGLSATTGANVNASPSATTTYTVSGTDMNGCVNTATAAITVGQSVYATATATPSTICSGGNSQLLGTAFQNFITPVANTYIFSTSTNTYAPLSGGTASTAIGDDGTQTSIPIGFSFNYNATDFTTFGISTNGTIKLGTGSAGYSNALASNANVLAPMWDDNNLSAGTITYSIVGTAPNRILTVDWNNVSIGGSGATTGSTNQYQIQLFETSNIIKFNYGSLNTTNTLSASIGISGAAGNYISVTPGAPATTSTSIENTSISAVTDIPSGTTYIFTPTGIPTFTYSWSPSTFITGQETLGNPLATAVTATTAYTVSITGNVGCVATANATVTVSAGAAINTQPISISKCTGETATFTVDATGAGLTYQWRKNGVDIPIGTNASAGTATLSLTNVSALDATTYDVIVTSSCGSPVTSDGTSVLTVKPVPTATASSNSPICSGSSLNLTGTTDIGTSYDWAGPVGFTSNSQNPTISNAASTATGTYSFTATLNGCSSTISTTAVTVNPSPEGVTALASLSTIACGASIDLTSTPNSGALTLLSEDFNGVSNSWIKTNTSTGGTPANADWTLEPDGYAYVSGTTTTFHSNDNTQFYMSNSDAQGSGLTATTLESPAFNTMGLTSCSLSFFHYFKQYTGSAANVEVYDGTTWTSLATFTATQGTSTAFTDTLISLDSYLGLPVVKVRFNYTAPWGYYWALDNVIISANNPTFTFAWTSSPAGFTSSVQNPTSVAPSVTTTYTVEVTSPLGCSSTANATVTVNGITEPILGNDTTLCGNANILLDAGAGYDSYLWSTGANTQTITLDTTGIGMGTFHIWAKGIIGTCYATDTIYVTFTTCVGLNDNNEGISISVVPNPSNGIINLTVNGANGKTDLVIYSLHGQLLYTEQLNVTGNYTHQLDLSTLPKGIYIVKLSNEKTSSINKMIIE
jgi:hypothetical protein